MEKNIKCKKLIEKQYLQHYLKQLERTAQIKIPFFFFFFTFYEKNII